jgi:hypothetical protein
VTSPHVTTAAFRAAGRFPIFRKAAWDLRMGYGPAVWIIRSVRMAFRETRRIIRDWQNAARIAFRPGRMAR